MVVNYTNRDIPKGYHVSCVSYPLSNSPYRGVSSTKVPSNLAFVDVSKIFKDSLNEVLILISAISNCSKYVIKV